MNNKKKLLLSSGLAVLLLSACTKEIDYKEVAKLEVMEKGIVDTKSVHVFQASVGEISRSSSDALPFSTGDSKRVKLEWTKDALRVIELEKDARFQGNDTNNKLVLEIPVDHIDYQCTKDKHGECTNSEEEKTDVNWSQKGKFKLKLEAAKSAALEILPIVNDKSFGGNCYEEIASKVARVNIEKDAINLSIERTFRTNAACINWSTFEGLADGTVSAVYHYSMVKADSILSKDFNVVSYPKLDENTFGFFSTEKTVLDTDNNASEASKKVLMNHWNPNRKEIHYHLSPEFAKDENKTILELTKKTVENINAGLKISGANFQLTLEVDTKENHAPGDIRRSSLILVEDPVASSVIGYGPSTEDPGTGEIISARTVMFLGTIKKYIRYTYDDIVREKRKLAAKTNVVSSVDPQEPQPEEGGDGGLIIENGRINPKALGAKVARAKFKAKSFKSLTAYQPHQAGISDKKLPISVAKMKQINKSITGYTARQNDLYKAKGADGKSKLQAHWKFLQEAKHCAYGLNGEIMEASISPRLMDKFSADAKPWDQLDEEGKQKVIAIILPEIWVPTLIHEMGHNLGLRHNFQGSEDAANFYSEQELAALNIDHNIPFSSVMEYGDDLKALPVLGKYDIAALRYAYAGLVQLSNGEWVNVRENLQKTVTELKEYLAEATQKEKDKASKEGKDPEAVKPVGLKDYGFCTDEHTGINAGCRRFDLGTTFEAIVENEIKAYLDAYNTRNLRAGRLSMSLFEDPQYALRVHGRFQGLRLIGETYERIKNSYGIPDDHPVWSNPEAPFLVDLKKASTKAADFLMSVVATPDLTCVIAQTEDAKAILSGQKKLSEVQVEAIRLDELMKIVGMPANLITCKGIDLGALNPQLAQFHVIGQYGKLTQSRKDPASENSYADQIDVRGYWIDKAMAARVLFERQMGASILDEVTDNVMDRADLAQSAASLAFGMLMNQVSGVQEVELIDGGVQLAALPVDTAGDVVNKTIFYDMQDQVLKGLGKALGMDPYFLKSDFRFSELLAHTVRNNMVDSTHILSGQPMADAVSVRVLPDDISDLPSPGYEQLKIGSYIYRAGPQHLVANESIKSLKQLEILSQVDEAKLMEIFQMKATGQAKPETLTPAEAAVWDLETAVIQAALMGVLPTADFLQSLLISLPN